MQYRAIGLVRGVYVPSEEQFTRGNLMTEDETCINAVLLGRIMSLVKNHLDIEKEHLWVVYPRTRSKDGELHAQIVGVWEPETLDKDLERGEENEAIASETQPEDGAEAGAETGSAAEPIPITDGYFSIRGEIIYHSQPKESTVVRIVQAPRKGDKKSRFFKIELKGSVTGKTMGHFWDFHVLRQGTALTIQAAEDIGQLPKRHKKRPYSKKPRRRYGGGASGASNSSPTNRPARPIRKPVPRSAKSSETPETPPPQSQG